MTKMMRAARLHETGKPFQIDTIPVPEVRPTDVLVEVKAAGVVPNLRNVVTHYPTWFPFLPLPKLPRSTAWIQRGWWRLSAAA